MHTIRLKIRDLEIEAAGFDSYDKFQPFLDKAVEIWKSNGGHASTVRSFTAAATLDANAESKSTFESVGGGLDISINSFVAKVGGATCRSLLKATAGYLVIAKAQEKIRREDLVEQAKESTSWKKNYTNQVPVNINRMIKQGEIIENAADVYSLPSSVVEEMKSKLNG